MACGKKTCPCGDRLVRCPWKLGMSRGKGRAYLRCAGCQRWYDIMAFSPLPVLKMPLPLLQEAISKYFAEVRVPSVQSVARALQVSGGNHSPLFRLFRALQMAEVRCMDWTQSRRTLTGQCDEKVKHVSMELSWTSYPCCHLNCWYVVQHATVSSDMFDATVRTPVLQEMWKPTLRQFASGSRLRLGRMSTTRYSLWCNVLPLDGLEELWTYSNSVLLMLRLTGNRRQKASWE